MRSSPRELAANRGIACFIGRVHEPSDSRISRFVLSALSYYFAPVVFHANLDISIAYVEAVVPIKPIDSPPFARQMEVVCHHRLIGVYSQVMLQTFSAHCTVIGCLTLSSANCIFFCSLLLGQVPGNPIKCKLERKLVASFTKQDPNPPFSDEDLIPSCQWPVEFLEVQGMQIDWSIP